MAKTGSSGWRSSDNQFVIRNSGREQGTGNREQQEKTARILSLEKLNLFMGTLLFPVPRSLFPLSI